MPKNIAAEHTHASIYKHTHANTQLEQEGEGGNQSPLTHNITHTHKISYNQHTTKYKTHTHIRH